VSAIALLQELRERGVAVRADDGDIDIDAPPNVLTVEIVDALRRAKPQILAALSGEAWLDQAREAIDERVSGPIKRGDLESLRDWKRSVLCAAPQTAPDDPARLDQMRAAARALSRQVEALDLLVRGLHGAPIDRTRLATLTMEEAWRLNRHDVLERVWRQMDEGTNAGEAS
jgi:hypothetical protein